MAPPSPADNRLRLTGHEKDLGSGFTVRRLLPALQLRSVGPFVFFDHFGPVTVEPADQYDVRPHPHIGLATVTYLFEGAIEHRDSLGSDQVIEPGAINWMSAGRGIVHSERRPQALAAARYVNHGIQLWAALPAAQEESEPSFVHTPAADIPQWQDGDAVVRVLVGEAFGLRSPVATLAPALYLDVRLPAGAGLELPSLAPQMAVYPVDGDLLLGDERLARQTLATLEPGQATRLAATDAPVRCIVIGGEPLDGPRHLWWNFVSSRKERIVQAAHDWERQAMGHVPDETDWIPLPERRFKP
ncbi:pirin family protein [Acidovorax sp. FG27]|uniref:pirin family protein n=1 Tax=Acidovorax sp. FG27 TaxID=3133652 RepID=UPI0030E76860